jgi:hypothetical protein
MVIHFSYRSGHNNQLDFKIMNNVQPSIQAAQRLEVILMENLPDLGKCSVLRTACELLLDLSRELIKETKEECQHEAGRQANIRGVKHPAGVSTDLMGRGKERRKKWTDSNRVRSFA